jgi:photosystem II stability/assembly factor-like uncharacterized protein
VRSATAIALAQAARRSYDRGMLRRTALACLALAALARGAAANGRAPATSTITFRQGHESDVAIGLTFGLLISHDAGKTWTWMCENAVGYTGTYDPHYAFSASGALFATTFTGVRLERDACTFAMTPAGTTFASVATLGPDPDHIYYYAASQPADLHTVADFKIYKSTDDGVSFTPVAPDAQQPPQDVSWWQTLEVAPSDPLRLYLTGYRFADGAPGMGKVKQPLLLRSEDGGATWIPVPIDAGAVTFAPNSVMDIVGIDATNPDHLYARVEVDDNTLSDSIYRSTDKGATWHRINHKAAAIRGFVVRANRDLVVGTQALGAEVSHDDGDTWTPLAGPPHITCLVENAAHEVWACTQNYGFSSLPADDAGIMKTTDLATWTKVLRYQDLTDAASCAAGTVQHDTCVVAWCGVCAQLGCTPPPSYGCPVATEAQVTPPARAGCCDTGSAGEPALALALGIGALVVRPRRRRR